MNCFLAELRYFWHQVRGGYPRQHADAQFTNRMRSFMGLEFESATPEQCVDASEKIVIALNRLKIKVYADHLYTRCNRGKLKIGDFVADVEKVHGLLS